MRFNRVKSPEYKYHIRIRGMKEILLFRDNEDKDKYLAMVIKYKKLHNCKIYAYCLMDTHGHFFIDPCGYDISQFMHKVNLCYAQYYNKKYKRIGPVFAGRFESNPVCTYNYSLALSAYIHNNPKDIIGYRGKEEYFYYSSYGIYAEIRTDTFGILNLEYLFSVMRCMDIEKARKKYLELVRKQNYNKSIKNIIECLSTGEIRIVDEETLIKNGISENRKLLQNRV